MANIHLDFLDQLMPDLPSMSEGGLLSTLIAVLSAAFGAVVAVFTMGRKAGSTEND